MEFLFEVTTGGSFPMVVNFNDTVGVVKLKIQESRGVPVLSQFLIYRDEVLRDGTNFTRFRSFKGVDPPRILLVIPCIPPAELLLTGSISYPHAPPPETMKVPILFQIPSSRQLFSVQIDVIHTVGKLREIIEKFEGIPARRIVVHYPADVELSNDRKMLMECGIAGPVEVKVSYRSQEDQELLSWPSEAVPPLLEGSQQPLNQQVPDLEESQPQLVPDGLKPASKRLRPWGPGSSSSKVEAGVITVFLSPFGERIPVEVSRLKNVGILRVVWKRLVVERPELRLPAGINFRFGYEGRILDENETFQLQLVKDGAVIGIVEALD